MLKFNQVEFPENKVLPFVISLKLWFESNLKKTKRHSHSGNLFYYRFPIKYFGYDNSAMQIFKL